MLQLILHHPIAAIGLTVMGCGSLIEIFEFLRKR